MAPRKEHQAETHPELLAAQHVEDKIEAIASILSDMQKNLNAISMSKALTDQALGHIQRQADDLLLRMKAVENTFSHIQQLLELPRQVRVLEDRVIEARGAWKFVCTAGVFIGAIVSFIFNHFWPSK